MKADDLDFFRQYRDRKFWKTAKRGDHEYTIRQWDDNSVAFNRAVRVIRAYGQPHMFYTHRYVYLEVDDHRYWTMGSPVSETTVINRAHHRLHPPAGPASPVMNPMLDDLTPYDVLAIDYDARYETPECLAEDDALFAMLRPHMTGTVLDVGCGTGLLLRHIPVSPRSYLGIDVSRGMLNEFVRRNQGHRVAHTRFEDHHDGHVDTLVALYGVASYWDPAHYSRVLEMADEYFVMFYTPGYAPSYYDGERRDAVLARPDYDLACDTFDTTFTFANYLCGTNMDVSPP